MTNAQLFLKKVADGKTWTLKGELLVGREPPADVLLTEGHCSRRHARFAVNAEGVTVEDLKSSNGTFVNNLRIDSKVRLKRGDKVRFDTVEFVIDAPVDPDATKVRPSEKQDAPAPAPAPPLRAGGRIADPKQNTVLIPAEELRKHQEQIRIQPVPSATDGVASLRVTSGSSAGREIRLTPKAAGEKRWQVGSDPGRDVRLSDSGVSGLHATIVNEGEKWKVIDEMSANGTFVNGKRSPMSYLRTGDLLQFGSVVCLLQLPKGGGGDKAATAPRGRKVWLAVATSFIVTLLLFYVIYRILD